MGHNTTNAVFRLANVLGLFVQKLIIKTHTYSILLSEIQQLCETGSNCDQIRLVRKLLSGCNYDERMMLGSVIQQHNLHIEKLGIDKTLDLEDHFKVVCLYEKAGKTVYMTAELVKSIVNMS